ncbi:MAG: hypothetical protein VB076_00580, partial [Synergistaceae bacterium]|nr:hypothetical protein [Synergistaceae bacterium]
MWVNSASTEIPISVFPCKSNVSRALDCGVTGVMVPMVKNGDEARKFADWAKFAPVGQRGLGGSGAHTEYLD